MPNQQLRKVNSWWVCQIRKPDAAGVITCTGVGTTEAEAEQRCLRAVQEVPVFIQDLPAEHRKEIARLYDQHYPLGRLH